MDFKSLVQENALADIHRRERMQKESEKLHGKITAFLDSLDKDMLIAISEYGENDYVYPGGSTKLMRCYKSKDNWNKLRIACSRDVYNGKPVVIMVLNGQHGLLRVNGCVDELIVAAVRSDNTNYLFKSIADSYWTDTNYCPDKNYNIEWFPGQKAWAFTDHRMVGDERNWFERCADALPDFVEDFKNFLINRAKGTK